MTGRLGQQMPSFPKKEPPAGAACGGKRASNWEASWRWRGWHGMVVVFFGRTKSREEISLMTGIFTYMNGGFLW